MRRRPKSLLFVLALLVLAAVAAGGSGSFAAFSSTTSTGADTFSAASDWTAPTVNAGVISGTGAGSGVKQGGTYNVYANVTDNGNPPSGVASVTANVSNVTTGQTAVALNACSTGCTVGGTTYGFKSAQLTARSPLSGTQSFTISATDADGNASGASSFNVTVDNTTPTVSASVIAHSSAGPGVKQAGTYFVYANATDTGSGVGTVTANVNNVTTGQTAVPLTACSSGCTVGTTTYAYKSAQLTAKNPLGAGTVGYTVTATDAAGNSSAATSFNVTVDNTQPTASSSATANGTGTSGLPEAGDKITLVTSQQLDPDSILSGWSGASTPIVVRITHAGGPAHDIVTFWDQTNTTQLPLGTIDMGRAGYVDNGQTISYGATGTASTLVQSTATLTITLGTPSAAGNRVTNTTRLTWDSTTTPTDLAGNSATGNAVTQGTAARQF